MELLEDNLVEEPSLPVRGIPLRCAFDASVFFIVIISNRINGGKFDS